MVLLPTAPAITAILWLLRQQPCVAEKNVHCRSECGESPGGRSQSGGSHTIATPSRQWQRRCRENTEVTSRVVLLSTAPAITSIMRPLRQHPRVLEMNIHHRSECKESLDGRSQSRGSQMIVTLSLQWQRRCRENTDVTTRVVPLPTAPAITLIPWPPRKKPRVLEMNIHHRSECWESLDGRSPARGSQMIATPSRQWQWQCCWMTVQLDHPPCPRPSPPREEGRPPKVLLQDYLRDLNAHRDLPLSLPQKQQLRLSTGSSFPPSVAIRTSSKNAPSATAWPSHANFQITFDVSKLFSAIIASNPIPLPEFIRRSPPA